MNILVDLYKLAHRLDKIALYSEANDIGEMMRTLAKRVGLTPKDMISLADYFDGEGEIAIADYFDEMARYAKENKKSKKPPKQWWTKMVKEIKKGNPDYSKERVAQTIGDIWFNNISDDKRKEIKAREGKK